MAGNLFLLAACALLCACAARGPGPSDDARASPIASASAPLAVPTPPVVSTVVRASAVAAPPRVVVDGDLAEWPSLVESARSAPSGVSTIEVAVASDAVHLAGELGIGARDGVWVGVASPVSELPPIGEWVRGGAIQELDCENERDYVCDMGCSYVPNGKKNPPEVAAACRALLDRYDQLKQAHERTFSRRWKIDRDGAHALLDDGTLAPIPGAKVSWLSTPLGAKLEASLPLTALPRVGEAPLASLSVWASAAATPPSDSPPEGSMTPLALPVSFEPYGDVRAALFDVLASPHYAGDVFFEKAGASYQPGDPLHVETMHYAGSNALSPVEETIFESKAKLGDVEVGVGHALFDYVVILKNGKLADVLDYGGGSSAATTISGIVVRDDEIHVVSYTPGGYTMMQGAHPPAWSVVAVTAGGAHHEAVDDAVERATGDGGVGCVGWGGPLVYSAGFESASKTFDTFRWRGSCATAGQKRAGFEIDWTWDAAQKKYLGTWRRIPVPKE